MNNENVKNDLDSTIGKMLGAFDRFDEATILFEAECYPGAVGRLYYSIFSAICALHYLDDNDCNFKSHKNVLGVFNKEYIHNGIFPTEYYSMIYTIQKLRHESDYGIRPKIKKEILEECFNFTEKFINEVKIYCSNKCDIPLDNLILKDKIENKKFIDAYIFFNENDTSHSDKSALSFMKEVVKEHGTDGEILKKAVEAVTDCRGEMLDFTAKLLQDTLKTDEYKKAFEAEQGITTEQENTK